MTLLYYDPIFLEHDTGDHPECAARILPAVRHLNLVFLDKLSTRPTWKAVSEERILRVHSQEHRRFVHSFAVRGGGHIDPDTVICPRSYDVALMAAGAVCDAVARVVAGEDANAFCLVRPPGHHALRDVAMGFCLLNNVALAARVATQEFGIERVLIVDWDVHHGNGTQAIFWDDPQIAYMSIHRWPFYPGTGDADETGGGAGLGTTLNLPVRFGTPRDQYLSLFTSQLEAFASKIRPQLVLISAGFDSHRHDPIGSLGLESEDFGPLTRAVLDVAATYAEGRLVSALEGGYHASALSECVGIHVDELLAQP